MALQQNQYKHRNLIKKQRYWKNMLYKRSPHLMKALFSRKALYQFTWYVWIIIMVLLVASNGALVQVQSVLSNQVAGELSDYRFTINRNVSVTGGAIVPSSLSNSFTIDIEFGPNFQLSHALPSSGAYSTFTIDTTNLIIKLNYFNVTLLTQIMFTLSNVTNSLVTSIYQPISIKIQNSSLSIVDQADISLLYTTSTLSQVNSWNQNFVPGNVSTLSNFQFSFIPDVWKNGKMLLTLAFSKYWNRSLQNTSATTIITTSTKCEPTCVISSKATFTEVQFLGLILNSSTKSVSIKILNILSPPTVQKIDIVSVSTYDSVFSSVIETGSFLAFSSRPNSLQSLTAGTSNKIQQLITLSLEITTMNVFGPNDTIILSLGQQILTSSINVTLFNGIVPSYNFDFLSNRQIAFSSFTILSSTYNRMAFTISLEKGLSPVRSTKPIEGNKISIRRNGFLYNEQTFVFSVLPALGQLSVEVVLSNNFVNFNSTMSLTVEKLREKVILTDTLSIVIPKQIKIYGGSCNPIGCIGCFCSMVLADDSTNQSFITISNFSVQGIASISVNLQVKNPIFGGQSISICHEDGQKYHIQCFNGSFPAVKQSTLGSRTIDFQSSSDIVYQISTYTLSVDLTQYALSQGYMLIYFQKGLYLVNTSIGICYVNDEPLCDLTSNSTVDQVIIWVSIMDVSIKVYRVIIENIRNPLSTQPFQFWVKVFTSVVNNGIAADLMYYQAESTFYSVSKALRLSNVQAALTPCKNSQPSTLTITFPNNSLPFDPKTGILIDNPNSEASQVLLRTTNQQTLWNGTAVGIPIQNHFSLESVRYSFLLKTLDLLYDVFAFEVFVKTCESSALVINSWKVSGLLGEMGQVNFVYDNLLSIDYMVVELPIEYSAGIQVQSNALSTTKISPRVFKIILSKVQPISIQLWNFTHSSLKSSNFTISTFKTSATDNKDYLVAQNLNTIFYDLANVTQCLFPCKICSSSNSSVCLLCYAKEWTENYLLVNGSCAPACQPGFYLAASQQRCERCNLACLTCEETKCITCVPFYYFLNGSCLTDCPAKYFPISANQTCSLCSYPCNNCVNSTTCISCVSPFYQTSSGKCVTNCQLNEYPISDVCRRCEIPCETCSLQLNNCTKCLAGFYFNSGFCVTVCPSPLVPAIVNGNNICTSCISPCFTCALSPNNCTSCVSPFKLHLQNCVTACPQSFYESSALCIPCLTECIVCSSSTSCSICATSYKLHNSRCISMCPLFYFGKIILNDQNLLVNGTEICAPCTNDNRCIRCQNESYCNLCSFGYFFTNGVCVNSCPVTTFADVNACRNCSASCLYCASESICEVCSSTTFLYQQKCITSCPNLTIPVEITVNILNPSTNLSSSFKTKTCGACGSIFSNCLSCTNISCISCKQNFVMEFDRSCQVSCSYGYINLNNGGYCIKCESQCVGCSKVLNNCTECANGFVSSIILTNGQQTRQCVSACPLNQIVFYNRCTSCVAPCQICAQNPARCTSCIQSGQQIYLFNNTCITQCPQNHYPFQGGCVQCQSSCKLCSRDGCLRCASGYFTSDPFTIPTSSNPSVQYYNCYVQCPANLPFVAELNVCKKCSQNCVSCNAQKCLQCTSGYFIYGQYCVIECPLPLVNYSRSCVNQTDIPVAPQPQPEPQPEPQTPQEPTIADVEVSYFSMPVPFCVGLSVVWLICLLSKCQHPQTHLSISFYALGSIVCIGSFAYYLVLFIINAEALDTTTTLLIVGLILNYIQNLVFFVLSRVMLFKDLGFQKITKARTAYKIFMLILATMSTHSTYILFFSRLFDFSMFKLYVENINCIRVINYLWCGQVLVYLIGCSAGILRILMTSRDGFTFSQTLQHFYQSIDLIVIAFIMFLYSILNFKKQKSVYLKEEDWISTQSTKKVIFDQSSNENIQDNSYESRDEFNICGKNFRVANQQTLLDNMIFPVESGNKFSMSSRDQSENYDNVFADKFPHDQQVNHAGLSFIKTIDEPFFIEKDLHNQDQRRELTQRFAFSKTVDILLRQEDMGQNLEEMRTVNKNQDDFDINIPKVTSEVIEVIPKQSSQQSQKVNDSVVQDSCVSKEQKIDNIENEPQQDIEHQQPAEKNNLEELSQKSQQEQITQKNQNQAEAHQVVLSKVFEQSEQQYNLQINKETEVQLQNQPQKTVNENNKEILEGEIQSHDLGSIENQKTAIGVSINQNSFSNHNIQPYMLQDIPESIPQQNQLERKSIESSRMTQIKSKEKNYQSSPKISSKLPLSSIKLKSAKVNASPPKKVFIPEQNFATDRQLSKMDESLKISGVYSLFNHVLNENPVEKTEDIPGQDKLSNENQVSFQEDMILSPEKSLLLNQKESTTLNGSIQKSKVNKKQETQRYQTIQNHELYLNSRQEARPQQNVKFYLEIDQAIPQVQQQIQRSRSFSPNSLKRKSIEKKSPRNKKNSPLKVVQVKEGTKKEQSKSKSLIKAPQYDMISYNKPKTKKQTEKNTAKQGLGSVLYEIARKQKVKSREKQLQGIYANKTHFN